MSALGQRNHAALSIFPGPIQLRARAIQAARQTEPPSKMERVNPCRRRGEALLLPDDPALSVHHDAEGGRPPGVELGGHTGVDVTDDRERDPQADELEAYGDSIMLAHVNSDMSEYDLDRTFGKGFSAGVVTLEPGQWAGPIESGYGLHLVKVKQRVDGAIPDWRDVRHKLVTDVQFEARKAAEDQLYAEIAPRYQIVYDDVVAGVLEGAAE